MSAVKLENSTMTQNTNASRIIQCEKLESDDYTTAIGETGKWQMYLLFVTVYPIKTALYGLQFGITFLAPKTSFKCVQRTNSSEQTENATCYSDCGKYEYRSEFDDSIITLWDLVCERAWLAHFAQTACMLGVLIGGILFGIISDRYGRRPTIIFAGLLETCAAFAMSFCTNYWFFIVVRILLGAGTAGTSLTSIVYVMEIFGPSMREILGFLIMIPLSIGTVLITAVAYYIRNRQDFSLCAAAITLCFISYPFILPESPKWLISVGRLEEACAVMTTAAKWNNFPMDNMMERVKNIARKNAPKNIESKAALIDLIRKSKWRTKTMCTCLKSLAIAICTCGIIQFLGQTSSNVFLSNVIMGVVEVPAFFLSSVLSGVLGRRYTIMIFFTLSAIGNGLLALTDDWHYVKLIAGVIGKCSSTAVTSISYVYSMELFPTVARSTAMGAAYTIARIGSLLAPFIVGLHSTAPWVPPTIFAITPMVGILTVIWLPETKGKPLEDQLED